MTSRSICTMPIESIIKAFMSYLDKNGRMDPARNSRAKISNYELMIFKMIEKFDTEALSKAVELTKHNLDIPAGSTHIEVLYDAKSVATFQIQ